jgi:GPH family glycoside/pentoside/hexuronide:cation symporter
MYLWLPMIFNILITIVLIKLNVEKTNAEIKESINN